MLEGWMPSSIVGGKRTKNKGFEKPGGVSQVPFWGAGFCHCLQAEILESQRATKFDGVTPDSFELFGKVCRVQHGCALFLKVWFPTSTWIVQVYTAANGDSIAMPLYVDQASAGGTLAYDKLGPVPVTSQNHAGRAGDTVFRVAILWREIAQ